MMRLKISHNSTYTFTSEIFLEPHYFRFIPKVLPHISLESYHLEISPKPIGLSQLLDAENNQVHLSWYEGLHTRLQVIVTTVIAIKAFNPFNFLIYPASNNTLPIMYPSHLNTVLYSALSYQKLSTSLKAYAEKVKSGSDGNTMSFIAMLTNKIHRDFTLEYRHEGQPLVPDETFTLKRGSCRDLTWMQIQLLRYSGIASRFVSGYYYIELEKPNYELHAWLEVYIPGAGWIGFDPSNGIAVTNTHIPVMTSVNFESAMPITGSIRGEAKSSLTTQLAIEVI